MRARTRQPETETRNWKWNFDNFLGKDRSVSVSFHFYNRCQWVGDVIGDTRSLVHPSDVHRIQMCLFLTYLQFSILFDSMFQAEFPPPLPIIILG